MRKIFIAIAIFLFPVGGIVVPSNFSHNLAYDKAFESNFEDKTGTNAEIEGQLKTYEEFLIDFGVSKDNITEQDLSGSGTKNDPFVIWSTKGFLFFMNESLSEIPDSKCQYVELGNDIILNDETFDENGKPTSGDGTYYNLGKGGRTVTNFDGKGFTIKGLYKDNGETEDAGLFEWMTCLKNTTVENVYMSGKSVVVFAGNIPNGIYNCKVTNGTLRASEWVCTFAFNVRKGNVENCVANVNLYSNQEALGICRGTNNVINCINYGDIIVQSPSIIGNQCSGITAEVAVIENCINYGDIYAPNNQNVSGIVSAVLANRIYTYKNCKNYGNIIGKAYQGGISGMTRGIVTMIGCENYGEVTPTSGNMSGAMIGCLFGAVDFQMIDCISKTKNTELAVIGNDYGDDIRNVFIKDCKFIFENKCFSDGLIYVRCSGETNLQIQDTEVFVNLEKKTSLVGSFAKNGKQNVNLKNVIVRGNGNFNKDWEVFWNKENAVLKVDGLIFDLENGKYFFGSDFSDFYVSLKTGKIGLKTRDGNGFFQTKVNEDILERKGFEKKTI